ncbi:MAG: hypothetical protein COU85_01710 [Candidatus Portnoybacteria bacterium CG10_big_fil_rev_8_21_14_0_10_44_7]|uniref:Dipeptidylpeptidase IV N-terminal domain-containing protein n=1 Tax=Candidatus Portnoybacteria bacterium CG10_big_fil_rev_8_21_14_0_10_44_7 TaxID=1974816 RepID=A0A2M8KIR9_9BACT|nr:MAG: hypothetical protein COU85_01710 [Candidatus Portnoybacteria bacterium CG10_big_fil_rev_8_21_14_0_10_44_7]
MNPKKFFLISLIALIIILGALLVYNFFLKDNAEPTTAPGQSTDQPTGPIIKISDGPVISPALDEKNNQLKYYTAQDGLAFAVDFAGQNKKELSGSVLTGFIKALWSPDTNQVIGLFAAAADRPVKKAYYNYQTKQSTVLDENIAWVAWSPDGQKIAYEYLGAGNNNNISVANPDGTGWTPVFQTRLPDWQIAWVAENKISLTTPPSGQVQGVLYDLNPKTQDFAKILSDYYGLKPLWSPRADKILFSATDPQTNLPKLMITDSRGENTKELVLQTVAEKCAWSQSNNTIFCAVPQSLATGYQWPDDYYKGLITTKDNFYKINFDTGQQTQLFISGDQDFYDATSLMLDPAEKYLFFYNQYDSQLYRLSLE